MSEPLVRIRTSGLARMLSRSSKSRLSSSAVGFGRVRLAMRRLLASEAFQLYRFCRWESELGRGNSILQCTCHAYDQEEQAHKASPRELRKARLASKPCQVWLLSVGTTVGRSPQLELLEPKNL